MEAPKIASFQPELGINELCQILPDIVAVVATDGTILAANEAFDRLIGHPVSRWLGKRFDPLIHPDDLERVRSTFDRAISHPAPTCVEARVLRPDGSCVHLEAHIRTRHTEGYGDLAFAVVRDVSEKKRLQRLLEVQEHDYRLLFERNPCPMWAYEKETSRFLMVNEAAVQQYGYTKEEFLSMTIANIQIEEDTGRLGQSSLDVTNRLPASSIGEAGEWRHRKKDGRVIDVDLKWTPIEWDGKPATLVLATDITRRKLAEQRATEVLAELRHSNEELSQFASLVSHDLQEPLRTIQMYLGLVEKKEAGHLGTDAKEYIDLACSGSKRLRRLIGGLLEYAQVGRRMQLKETDATALVQRVLLGLRPIINQAGATIEVENLPNVWADELLLAQVFQNLITNAIKFRGSAPPRVSISATVMEEQCRFEVKDNGMGIAAHDLETIFIGYDRLRAMSLHSGVGLGLTVTKKIVRLHGGRIWAQSYPEEGTTFYFTIPRAPAAQPAQAS